jgi:hypothetical protein
MTDYKALAERVITADGHAITSWFESGEERITCEALKQRQIEAVAAVLRSALTPEWKDVPDKLPEGAVYGYYRSRNKKYRNAGSPMRWDHRDVAEEREYWAQGELSVREFMLIAAFDTNDNPVANPMRNSMSGAHKEA